MKSQRYSDPDKKTNEEVQHLDLWQTGEDYECRQKLNEIERGYRLKLGQQDEVEQELLLRRNKHKLPSVSVKPSNEMQELITEKRIGVRKHAASFKEKSRFAKVYEEELEETKNKYEAELEDLIFNRERLRKDISDTRHHLIELALDLEAQKVHAVNQEVAEKKLKDARELSLNEYFFRRNTIQQNLERKFKEYDEYKVTLNTQLANSSKDLEVFDERVHQIKENLKLVRRTQIEHYLHLLKDGLDSRNEGLEWIVKALWKLDFKLKRKYFPTFLDEEADDCIMEFAKLSCEYDRLHVELEKEVARSKQSGRVPDRWNGVKKRLKRIQSNIKTQRRKVNVNFKTKEVDVIWEDEQESVERIALSPSRELMFDTSASIEKQMIYLRRRINEMKDKEIERLTHACFMNNYEKKFGIEMKSLLSCVVGIDSIDRYLASINREQKTLSSQLQQSKTFKFSKNHE
eukprot:CAMPEP_0204900110 /NCGR_PEP_ID=MMETSP1397-20131031/2266_1 /ASSEMBLY_ACC=CAM_ASM_000891 /TAXON_ID=49980 /ORGANISM="Climacostomum Climacostomum virens, Strain Stock W-24" /LENGTH=459 /DNA_ID=CAMNT_0052068187 /DNA_START=2414 /DNA_END=3793 /DNA_ORIENTATION=-